MKNDVVQVMRTCRGTLEARAAEGLDDEDEQDGLGPAQAALDHGGVLVHEKERFAQWLEDVIGQEQEKDVQGQQERFAGLPVPDVGEEPEEPVAEMVAGLTPRRGPRR